MDYLNRPPFRRSAYFYLTIMEDFEPFQYLHFESSSLKNGNYFQKTGALLKMQHFDPKLSSQKPMLRKIGWGVQNGCIKKNGILPLFFFF